MPSYIPMDVFGLAANEAMPGFADVRLTTVMGGFVLGWAWLGGRGLTTGDRCAAIVVQVANPS